MITHADLDGLGASEGALITWTIPSNMRRTMGPEGGWVSPMNLPTAARTGNYDSSWWVFAVVLCLAFFLVSRLKSGGRS